MMTIIAFSTSGSAILCGEQPTLVCCDLYGNDDGDWVGNIIGQLGINGNICEDPLFCARDSQNYTLQTISPCAPENHPECGLVGAWPVGCEPAGIEEPGWPDGPLLLASCAPNPLRSTTRISYLVSGGAGSAPVRIEIFDSAGRSIRALLVEPRRPGAGRIVWDGTDRTGETVAAGVYFLRLSVGGRSQAVRIVVAR